MPGFSPSEISNDDPQNTSTVVLGAFGIFTGEYVDVSGYSSISVTVNSDVGSVFGGIEIEWSHDGITALVQPQLFTFDPLTISQNGFTVHTTVRARFYRVMYKNGSAPQTFFILSSLLRKGAPSGTVRSIDPVNTFTTNLDVQSVQSLISGVGRNNTEQVQIAKMDDVDVLVDGSFLFVSPRPAKANNVFTKTVTATLTPTRLTRDASPISRANFLSISNNVLRGNLYIQLQVGTGLTTKSYDYKVLPGHTWQDPGAFGSVYAGDIWGVWDEVYIQSVPIQAGHARTVINYYG